MKKFNITALVFLLCSALVFLFCIDTAFAKNPGKSEPLVDLVVDQEGIEFTVFSNGCTSKESFEIKVNKNQKFAYNLNLIRIKPDYCRMATFEKTISYSYKEIGIRSDRSKIRIKNFVNLK